MIGSMRPQWRRTVTPLFLAFLSLVVAIGIWIAVTEAENPTLIDDFSGTIEVRAVNVPEGLAVARIDQPVVKLRVSTDEQTFDDLTAGDFRAEVDLSGVTESGTDLQRFVITRVIGEKENDVEILSAQPETVTVLLQPEITKTVPVRVNRIGSAPQGYGVETAQTNPASARVRGATSLINLVDSAEVDVNLTGLRVDLKQQFPLVARDNRGAVIRGVVIEPANADVTLNLIQQDIDLPLLVSPQIQGGVADGYNLIAVVLAPQAVTIRGPLDALQSITSVQTEPIDVSGLRGDLTRSVRLSLPARVQANPSTVSVSLKVVPARGDIVLNVAPEVTSISEGLTATLQTSTIDVRLRGEMPRLRSLTPGAVKAVVNASGLGEGIHILPATISGPGDVEILGAEPSQVIVILKR